MEKTITGRKEPCHTLVLLIILTKPDDYPNVVIDSSLWYKSKPSKSSNS